MVVFFQRNSRFSRKRGILLLCDVCCLAAAHLLAVWFRLGTAEWWPYVLDHLPYTGISILLYLLVYYASGMYDVGNRHLSVFQPVVGNICAASIIGLVFYAAGPDATSIGRGIWMIAAALILVFSIFVRRIFIVALYYGFLRRPALIVTDQPGLMEDMVRMLRGDNSLYRPDGILLCGPPESVAAVPSLIAGVPVLGTADDLVERVGELEIAAVLLAVTARNWPRLLPKLRPLRYGGLEIQDYVSLCETLRGEIPLDCISEEWLMTAALNSSITQIRNIKRAMDIFCSIVGLVPGIPVMLLCGLLVKLTSRGPVFYAQKRVGLNGKVFTLYKLRSMAVDAESSGAVWAAKADPRVTRVGYYLRKFRLDELPQLFNILKGEMSLVGPRPERPEFTETLAAKIPYYNERLAVRPGLTGWAQVKFPYAASLDAAARKLQFDLYYLKNMGFFLDVAILLQTFKTILAGLRHEDDASMAKDERLASADGLSAAPPPPPPAP
jgi:exopolysaccharide biosynthesis polyprenyl glycosylphosphotransferase